MRVRVLYFAAVRELVTRDEESLELGGDVLDVAALRRHLERIHPELAGRLGHVRLARNARFAGDAEELAEGDEIALIPPVAGG